MNPLERSRVASQNAILGRSISERNLKTETYKVASKHAEEKAELQRRVAELENRIASLTKVYEEKLEVKEQQNQALRNKITDLKEEMESRMPATMLGWSTLRGLDQDARGGNYPDCSPWTQQVYQNAAINRLKLIFDPETKFEEYVSEHDPRRKNES